jgi:hypothetical protein
MDKVKTLNNSYTDLNNCVGYCTFHHVYLTEGGLKSKQCLEKQNKRTKNQECGCLKRLDHDFWIYRLQKKIEKKNKEEREKKATDKVFKKIQRSIRKKELQEQRYQEIKKIKIERGEWKEDEVEQDEDIVYVYEGKKE